MALLNTFFIARDDAEALALADRGPDGFASAGMTDIELDTLLATITGDDYDVITATPSDFLRESEEEWLVRVRPELVAALPRLSEQDMADVAGVWSTTDELVGSDVTDLTTFIRGLASLARQATEAERPLYCLVSL